MPNSLTGGFDTVVLARLGIVNGLLAALHRNGGSEAKSPSLLHSFTLPVGSVPFTPDDHRILAWEKSFGIAGGAMERGKMVAAATPPGVLQEIQEATRRYEAFHEDIGGLTSWHGLAEVQASTPSVSFPPDSTSAVSATFKIRARFIRGQGSAALPGPIHGEVTAGFHVDLDTSGSAPVVEVTPSADDNEIYFTPVPSTGLDATDAGKISFQVRDALRNRFEPMTVELDPDFKFAGFKALGSGGGQVVALPAMLEGGSAPGLGGVQNDFLKSSDHFGIAVSKDFINPKMQPMLDSLESISFTQKVKFLGFITLATYNVSVSNAKLIWKTGELEVEVTGKAVTGSIFPNYDFKVEQRLTLVLDTSTQDVNLVAVGDPIVSGLPSEAEAEAKATIKSERDAAIASAQSQIDNALNQVSLDDALSSLDGAAPMEYSSIEIKTEGVVLHGKVEYRGASYAQVHIDETKWGYGFTGLDSWMPGGWVERFLWSWRETGVMSLPWGASVQTEIREHVFDLTKPSGVNVAGVCLAIEGTQVSSHGTEIPNLEGGDVCSVRPPSWLVATMPKWWDLFLPIWEIDPSPEERLDESILAHVNMNARATGRTRLGANTIVHFAGDGAQAPLDGLDEALGGLGGGAFQQIRSGGQERPEEESGGRQRGKPIAVCLVLPRGELSESRAEVEKRLGSLDRHTDVLLTITEDYEGRWSRAFAHEGGPGSYLLNARGEFVWQTRGEPEARAFVEASRHLLNGPEISYHPLRLDVPRCGPAPNVLFPTTGGRRMALRRLRGRAVWLVFWKSWSTPCVRELRRLEGLRETSEGEAPVVLAVNSGEDRECLPGVVEKLGLELTVVPDPNGRIARSYGVPCWPTTVFIDEDGNVSGAHYGAVPRASKAAD